MQKKKGISLIVLVITIIVMIILAATVVISLSNSGIMNKANHAVKVTNEKEVQSLASLVWAEMYLDNYRGDTLVTKVKEKLAEQGITEDDWKILVTDKGITIEENYSGPTLGSLVKSAADYGKTVNYEANGVTDWKVFYEDETQGYVYLIASEKLEYDKVPKDIPGTTVEEKEVIVSADRTITVGQIYWKSVPAGVSVSEDASKKWMAEWPDYTKKDNSKCVSYFLYEPYWEMFKSTNERYKEYVLGAIGTPTAEMFVASWNSKMKAVPEEEKYKYDKEMILTPNGENGYFINGSGNTTISTEDSLYVWSKAGNANTWFASPAGGSTNYLLNVYQAGYIDNSGYYSFNQGLRPVICLSSKIPAKLGTAGITDYVI